MLCPSQLQRSTAVYPLQHCALFRIAGKGFTPAPAKKKHTSLNCALLRCRCSARRVGAVPCTSAWDTGWASEARPHKVPHSDRALHRAHERACYSPMYCARFQGGARWPKGLCTQQRSAPVLGPHPWGIDGCSHPHTPRGRPFCAGATALTAQDRRLYRRTPAIN